METNYETKCLNIYNRLKQMPEHSYEKSHLGYFKNLEKYGIKYLNADGSQSTLSYVHFSYDHSEFMPDDKIYWKELAKGEYKKVVNFLQRKLTKACKK